MLGGMEQFFDIFILIFVQNWVAHAVVNADISIFTADSVPFDTSCVHLRTSLDVEYGSDSSFLDTMHIVHTQWVGSQNEIMVLNPVEDETTFKVTIGFINFTINNKGFLTVCDIRRLFMSQGTSIEEWVLDFEDSIGLSFENNLLRFEVFHGIQVLNCLFWRSNKVFVIPVFLLHGYGDLIWTNLLAVLGWHPVDSVFSLVHQFAVKLFDVSVKAHIKRVGVNEWLEDGEVERIGFPHIVDDDILHLVDLWQHLLHTRELFRNNFLLLLHELLLWLFQIWK